MKPRTHFDGVIRVTHEFGVTPITTLVHDGRLCWIAHELGRALGYADNGFALESMIRSDWQDDFIPGVDYALLDGTRGYTDHELRDLGAWQEQRGRCYLLALFASGVLELLDRSASPDAASLRSFWQELILPCFLSPNRDPEAAIAEALAERRRLLEEKWQRLRPRKATEAWLTAREIGQMLTACEGCVEHAISWLKVRDDMPHLCQPVLTRNATSGRPETVYRYAPELVPAIRWAVEHLHELGDDEDDDDQSVLN